MRSIVPEILTSENFAKYGDVIDIHQGEGRVINQGYCKRYNDLARLDILDSAVGISVFDAEPRALPYQLNLLERHPVGSQAFIPMSQHPFLIIVAEDTNGQPTDIKAFISEIGQGINFHKNTWHGVLTPLHAPGLFTVVDYVGEAQNLEEFELPEPVIIEELRK